MDDELSIALIYNTQKPHNKLQVFFFIQLICLFMNNFDNDVAERVMFVCSSKRKTTTSFESYLPTNKKKKKSIKDNNNNK